MGKVVESGKLDCFNVGHGEGVEKAPIVEAANESWTKLEERSSPAANHLYTGLFLTRRGKRVLV